MDISFNQTAGLSALCFLEKVLYKFLDYYSTFDWANYCISLSGPVLVSSLPAVVAESPENDGDELLLSRDFLNHCRVAYSGSMQPLEIAPNVFAVKYLNIIDPLKESNNLGRSVSKGNFHRIRCALSFGAQRLSEILMLPGENMGMALEKFFVNTLDRNGRGQRPDVQIPVHAFGTGKSEVCDLSGDYNGYYNGLLYSQWYHNYALNLPYHPTALSSSSSSQTHRYSAWDALRRLVRCKRNSSYRKGTNVFIPRPPYSHPSALQLPAATYGATKSRGTGTFFPDMNHPSYRKMQASISTRNYVSSNPGLVQNPPKETDPIGDNGGNGDSHDFDLSTEQFPHLPTTERTMITHQSIPPAPKNPQAENPSQFLPVLQFGNIYESSSPMDTYSPLCVPSIEKQKDLSEFDRTITEPFQLRDNNDFPPLVSM
ncbi:DEP domain-containing 5 [Gossypium arboreum]|uniref:DEP domain-containing 5 n=1 Tax=Gossypium arboreum TaxID=29729 RepID=A0A0B0ML64_GOSAR|nr:DEP domain-containing 5 [Gossypium arboreum]